MRRDPQTTHGDDGAVSERIRAAAATVVAPEDLRRRIDAQRRVAPARHARWAGAAALAVAIAVLALVVVVRDQGPGTQPSLGDAAGVALSAPTTRLAPGDQHGSTLRGTTVDGVTFPNYAYSGFDVRAVGMRRERTRGRDVVAVTYDDGGSRIGYAIVAAPTVEVPHRARTVTQGGTRFALLRENGAAVVTWRREGKTCVLASRTASHERLLRIATWRTRS